MKRTVEPTGTTSTCGENCFLTVAISATTPNITGNLHGSSATAATPVEMLASLGTSGKSAGKLANKSDTAGSNAFTGTIAVTVIEVLANGHLIVSGEKQIAMTQGTEYIRFAESLLAGHAFASVFPPGYPALVALAAQLAHDLVEARGLRHGQARRRLVHNDDIREPGDPENAGALYSGEGAGDDQAGLRSFFISFLKRLISPSASSNEPARPLSRKYATSAGAFRARAAWAPRE